MKEIHQARREPLKKCHWTCKVVPQSLVRVLRGQARKLVVWCQVRSMSCQEVIEVSQPFWTITWLIKGIQFKVNPRVLIILHAFLQPRRWRIRSKRCNKEIKRWNRKKEVSIHVHTKLSYKQTTSAKGFSQLTRVNYFKSLPKVSQLCLVY